MPVVLPDISFTTKERDAHARKIQRFLARTYPDATCALVHTSPYQLLVATILSAQCTDVRVNMVTPALFEAFPTVEAMAATDEETLIPFVRSTGFYRNKARNIIGAARTICSQYNGHVPDSMEELLTLPGVARKTANVILGTAFEKNEGIVVDTHVIRLSGRWGLSRQTAPDKIEKDLMTCVPRKEWGIFSHRVVAHGRQICTARSPQCATCGMREFCPSAERYL